mgnify:CR=1 FL=1
MQMVFFLGVFVQTWCMRPDGVYSSGFFLLGGGGPF